MEVLSPFKPGNPFTQNVFMQKLCDTNLPDLHYYLTHFKTVTKARAITYTDLTNMSDIPREVIAEISFGFIRNYTKKTYQGT